MSLVRITAPTEEPLSLAETRLHLRLDDDVDDDNAMLTSLITTARAHAEQIVNQPLAAQAWRLRLDCFPCGDTIDLEMPGVDAVSTFSYVDPSGSVVNFTSFVLDSDAFPSRVVRSYGVEWPATRVQRNAVTIEFSVAAPAADVLEVVKSAMKLMIGHWYENRTAVNIGNIVNEIPLSAQALLAPYRRMAMEMA